MGLEDILSTHSIHEGNLASVIASLPKTVLDNKEFMLFAV